MQAREPQIVKKPRTIKNWAKLDRPRERLIIKGPDSLSDAELLAILIGKGTVGFNAVEVARTILRRDNDDLHALGKRSVQDLLDEKLYGFGEAKAVALVAAFELGRRRHAASPPGGPVFKDGRSAAGYVRPLLADLPHEMFGVLYLDQSNRLKHWELVSKGGITATYVDPRLIFKRALQEEAVSIIVCHNHPSGNLRPSHADETLTARIKEASNYLDIKLLDHIIVSNQGYFSFAESGLI